MKTPAIALALFLALFVLSVCAQKRELQWKFVIFREDCFDRFFNKGDFSSQECIKLTLSKFIGFVIIVGSSILKVPQILKIVRAASVEGISKSLFYLEIVTLLHASAYSMRQGIPFSVYGESLIILGQNLVIVMLFWVYSKTIPAAEKAVLFLAFTAYAYVLFSADAFLGDAAWKAVQQSNMFIMVLSRVPQIVTNFQSKSTGQLAFFTFLLNFLGGVARLGTVLIETDDFMYQLQYFIGVALNGILVSQFLLYWKNTSSSSSSASAGETSPSKVKKAKAGKLE